MKLALLLLALPIAPQEQAQPLDDEPIPPTPYDRVIELEITAEDESLIDGKGPCVVVEYEVEFSGTLHIWTKSEMDLFLRVEDIEDGEVLVEDDDSGGGKTPYGKLPVVKGSLLAILVAAERLGQHGILKLHLHAAPATEASMTSARSARDAMRSIRALSIRDPAEGRVRIGALAIELVSTKVTDGAESRKEALWELGVLAKKLGELTVAKAAREAVLAHLERTLPEEHPELVRARVNLGITRGELGEVEAAHRLFEGALATWERDLPADHPDLLLLKSCLAITRGMTGDLEGARLLQEALLDELEKDLSSDHSEVLRLKLNLATTLRGLGAFEDALALEVHAHRILDSRLAFDHPDLLAAKEGLAITRERLGDLESALVLKEAVHEARERNLPAHNPSLLTAKLSLARILKKLGELERALVLEESVYAAREESLPADHRDLLLAKHSLAITRHMVGDYQGSLILLETLISSMERIAPDSLRLLSAKQNLASILLTAGDVAGAQPLLQEVCDALEELLPVQHPDRLKARSSLASVLIQQGDAEAGYEILVVVHGTLERLLPFDHPDLLAAKNNLADALQAQGRMKEALDLYEAAHSALAGSLPADHAGLAEVRLNLAMSRFHAGDPAGALELISQLLETQRGSVPALQAESPRLAREIALRQLQWLSHPLFISLHLSVDQREFVEKQLFLVLESLRMVSVVSEAAPAADGSRIPLVQARRRLSDWSQARPEESDRIDAWRQHLFELSEERDRLQRELRSDLQEQGLGAALAVEEVVDSLDRGSALISFLRYSRHQEGESSSGEPLAHEDALLAFVVTRDAVVRRVELGPSGPIETLLSTWRSSMGKPFDSNAMAPGPFEGRGIGAVAPRTGKRNERECGTELREQLLDPCLALLSDEPPEALYLILDDFLHLAPMDALPWGEDQLLGEVARVSLATSTGRLLRRRQATRGKGTLVVLGGVDYDALNGEMTGATEAAPAGASFRFGTSGRFGSLAHTASEAESLAGLYRDNVQKEPVLFQGPAASKASLHELALRARFLHIATHGWFAPETFKSMIDSAEEQSERDMFLRADQTLRGFAPETLCGLALAGANHGANSLGKVPGIITAEELATLDLSNCELAVLSACETNVGIRRAGQGIQSLQAALHAAGARTAITSLWRVDDAATLRLMELFYTKLWKDGLGKADALWQAKMALRDEGHGVGDWAGWVLTGDPD